MQYGIIVPPFGDFFDIRVLANLALDAENAGWDGFFVWDHVWFGTMPVADTWASLTAIGMVTTRMRLGPMVTPLPRRRPVKLARETVTLDHLSNGRLTLGVGIGSGPWEWEYLGEQADVTTRGSMLDEALQVLTQLWDGTPFAHRGKHFTMGGPNYECKFVPSSFQRPRIPIWVAGEWPHKPPFRRAGQWDGVIPLKADVTPFSDSANLSSGEALSPAEVRQIVAYIRRFRTDTNRFDVVISGSTSNQGSQEAKQKVASYVEAGATWWLEDISPWRFQWNDSGPWPLTKMREHVVHGPPGD